MYIFHCGLWLHTPVGPLSDLEAAVGTLKTAIAGIHAAGDSYKAAQLARVLRLETMIDIRAVCDAAEEVCPANLWTLATYKELLFLINTLRLLPRLSPSLMSKYVGVGRHVWCVVG